VPKRGRSDKTSPENRREIEPAAQPPLPAWKPITRLAFRFCFAYLALFCLATQISGSMIPNLGFYYRGLGRLWPMRDVTYWVGQHVFGATGVDVVPGGGEPLFFWVQTFWILIVAIAITAIWSIVDRRRENYVVLHKWFRVFIRFALAAAMLEYGMTKLIPTQFPPPSLETLVTPVGDLTLSALLWTSIGASPAYEIFTGCIEVLGGILLLLPRTTMLGALVSFAAMTQVFVLNMTYDVGLKLVSFHLILLAVFLLAPDFSRLLDFFLRERAPAPSRHSPLFATSSANSIALLLQVAFGFYLIGMYAYMNMTFWNVAGARSPRSPLYGIWDVEEVSVDRQISPRELHDYDLRWRRVIFDAPDSVTIQRIDDSFARYKASVDPYGKKVVMTKRNSKNWNASFTFTRASPDHVILEGDMDGHKVTADLKLVEFDTLRVLNSGFRWVRPQD
jgi:hypothetical protein